MNYWIFQGNPDSYKFGSSIQNDLLNVWNVKKHVPKIKKGDKAIIWITGKKGGCYGFVNILTDPDILGKSEDYNQWNNSNDEGRRHQLEDETVHKVRVDFIHNLFDAPILKSRISDSNGMIQKLKKGIRGTNFASSKEDFEMLLQLM